MKKILVIMALILAMSLTACGGKDEHENEPMENISREESSQKSSDKSSDGEQEQKSEEPKKEKEDNKDEAADAAEEEPEVKKEQESVKLSTVRSEIKAVLSVNDAADLEADSISGLYGIDSADIKDAAGFVVMAGTFPHEVVMIEAKDASAADRIQNMLSAKHQSFVEQSKGYDAENYALAQKCKVVRKGNQLSMFLTPDFETMQNVYNKYIK